MVGFFMKPQLLALAIFKGVRMTFKSGVTKYSAVFFAGYGFAMTNRLNDYALGKKCAEKALELLAKSSALTLSNSTDIFSRICFNDGVSSKAYSKVPERM